MTTKSDTKSTASIALEIDSEMRAEVQASSLFETLKSGLKKVTIEEENGPQEYYVAEGDTLLDEHQLGIYAMTREQVNAARRAGDLASAAGLGMGLPQTDNRGLVGVTQGGRHVRWQPGTTLTYRVVKGTFTSDER
ncbi:MAG: hypothetical protein ACR2PM_14405, partial [Hyphomicrobiales bacterium]